MTDTMELQRKVKVLVVDDDRTIRDFLTRLLDFEGLEARCAQDGYSALELAQKEKFDLIFMDIRMPRMSGLEAFSRLKKLNPELSCVFMTGYALEEALLEKTKQPGTMCLRKPFEDIRVIKDIANKALQEGRSSFKMEDGKRDRRAYARLDVAFEIDYKIKEKPGSSLTSVSKDISPGGIKIVMPEDIAAGTRLELNMRVRGSNESCRAQGEVIWNRQLPDKPGCYETGIQFSNINYEELAVLLIRSGNIIPAPMI